MKSHSNLLFTSLVLFTLCSSCILVKNTSVNPDKYLRVNDFDKAIYGSAPKSEFFSPFDMKIETAEKLINFDFKGHDKYNFLECQVYNDTIFGKGIVAMLMQYDGKLEIYHSKCLKMNQKHYYFDSVPEGIAISVFEPQCTFTFEEGKINFKLKFTDKYGNKIDASLSGNYPESIDFIAPMGLMGSGKPNLVSFPLFYMRKVNFLSTRQGSASILINDVPVKIIKIPGLLNWKRVQLARWSFDPILILWNWNRKGILSGIVKSTIYSENCKTNVIVREGYTEIKSIVFTEAKHSSTINFVPALPELLCLKQGVSLEGRFTIDVDEKRGVIGGMYSIIRSGDRVELIIDPLKCWQPIPGSSWAKKHYLSISLKEISSSEVEINSKWMVR